MKQTPYEIFWYILSRLAAISIVVIVIMTGFSRYKSDIGVISGLLLGIVLFLVFFSK